MLKGVTGLLVLPGCRKRGKNGKNGPFDEP